MTDALDLTPAQIAARLIANGYRPVPCEGKRGKGLDWPNFDFAPKDFALKHNVGIKTGQGIAFVDIDVTHPEASAAIVAEWMRRHPGGLQRTGLAPKTGFLVASDFTRKKEVKLPDLGERDKVEILTNGQQFIAYGLHPDTGKPYQWHDLDPLDDFLGVKDALLFVSEAKIKDFLAWVAEKYGPTKPAPKLSEKATPSTGSYYMTRDKTACPDEVAEILSYIPPDCGYADWLSVLMGLHEWSGGLQEGFSIADEWSAKGAKYKPGEVQVKWKGFDTSGGTKWATVANLARANGADLSAIARKYRGRSSQPPTGQHNAPQGQETGPDAPEPRSFEELLDAARAVEPGKIEDMEAIISECAGLNPMRADAVFRAIKEATKVPLGTIRAQLLQVRDAIPEPDHLDLARMTMDAIGRENVICTGAFVWRWQARGVWTQQDDRAVKQAVLARLDDEAIIDVTANLVNGVTDVLKSDIFRPDHEFNLGNPETVNCLNGELELHSTLWQLRPHYREHYRTTQIPLTYDPSADAPLFRAFLRQVFRDDPDRDDKIKAVLELMGYTLMSHARHEKFVMLIGPGANGKSVLLAVLEALLGSENVAGVQPASFDNRFQRAHLHQKLANIVTELKQGEVIADAELKAITSGEPATVEHKHKDPFVMRPFATCWFGTNHMPHTRDFSEALFRRATILQFNRTFAKSEQDPELKDKLKGELPGILNLALNAYAHALVAGFTEPASSVTAKQEWRLETDQVALFVDEACQRDPDTKTQSGDVFRAYTLWASENGISKTMSQKGLRDRLTRLGFGAYRDKTGRYVTGLRLSYWNGG